MSREFPVRVASGRPDAETLALVDELLARPVPGARAAGLGLIGRVGPVPGAEGHDTLASRLTPFLGDRDAAVRSAALDALRSFPAVWSDDAVRTAVSRALSDSDARVRASAILAALDPKARVSESAMRRALDESPAQARMLLLEHIGAEAAFRRDLRMLGVVSGALLVPDGGVREKALQLIQKHAELLADAAIEGGLRELARDESAGQRNREVARTLLVSRGRSSGGAGTEDRLDLAYFGTRILPLFNRMGEDGQNCIGCHRSHTILRLVPPDRNGWWSPRLCAGKLSIGAPRVVNLSSPSSKRERERERERERPPPGQADVGRRRGGRGPERPDAQGPRRRRPIRGGFARIPDVARLAERAPRLSGSQRR